MKHITALLVKYLFVLVATYLVLSVMLGYSGRPVFWVAAVLTLALYLLGDLMVLPAMGNLAATVADGGVALLLTWLAPFYSAIDRVPFLSALYVGLLIGVAEYFFHRYMQGAVLPGPVMDNE